MTAFKKQVQLRTSEGHIYDHNLRAHPFAKAINRALEEMGCDCESALAQTNNYEVIWHFRSKERPLSVAIRLYRYNGDGQTYLHLEVAFAFAAGWENLEIARYLLVENNEWPSIARLCISGDFLVAQVRGLTRCLDAKYVGYLLDTAIIVAQTAQERLSNVEGFKPLTESIMEQSHKVH